MAQIRKIKLGKILKQYRIEHWVDDDTVYKQVTITKDGHISQRGEKIGAEIGRKRQFIIDLEKHPNTLLFIRQTIWDGGIGLATPEVHQCIVTENFPMFEVAKEVEPIFLQYLFRSAGFYQLLSQIKTVGSAQKAIHERDFLNLEIPLPDPDTQKAIVSRLRELQTLHAQANATLARLQADVKRLRQSILQQAIQGKLVDNTLPPGEKTGAELLADIRAEKERRAREQGKKPDKPLPPVTEEEKPFELPEGWVWCRLGEILESSFYGPRFSSDDYVADGIPTIRTTDMTSRGQIVLRNAPTVKVEPEKMNLYHVADGDLLVTRSGSIGIMAVFRGNYKAIPSAYLIRFRFMKGVLSEFIYTVLKSPYWQKIMGLNTTATSQVNINASAISEFIIPIPPSSVQCRIIDESNEHLAKCDQFEQQLILLTEKITRLWQSEMQQIFKFESNGEANN